MTVLVDSGFLVALGLSSDPRHASARTFVQQYRNRYLVPLPVIVESCYFLSATAKVKLLDWVVAAECKVLQVPEAAMPEIANVLARYHQLDPDFTDAAIVWLANVHDCSHVLTVDSRDFSVYRIGGRRKFRLVEWCG